MRNALKMEYRALCLIMYDARTRTLIYELIDKPRSRVPVKNYTAKIKVKEISEQRCLVQWSGRFRPKYGMPDEVRARVEGVYATAIRGAKRKLGLPVPKAAAIKRIGLTDR